MFFADCLRRGLPSDVWKRVNVVPVHKENEKNLKGSYRPISFVTNFWENVQKTHTRFIILASCKVLGPNQSGFLPGDSTVDELLSTTYTIFKTFDCNPLCLSILRHSIGCSMMV